MTAPTPPRPKPQPQLPPSDMLRANCPQCGRVVFMAQHKFTGEMKPIDMEPHEWGNIELFPRDSLHPFPRYRYVSEAEREAAGSPLYYRAHAMSCPVGRRWRAQG